MHFSQTGPQGSSISSCGGRVDQRKRSHEVTIDFSIKSCSSHLLRHHPHLDGMNVRSWQATDKGYLQHSVRESLPDVPQPHLLLTSSLALC